VPLEELVALPGTVPIRNGRVRPTDAPGFGIEVTREWLERRAV
jgi:L-alanine-DL-glutamate epimerase-like enolase superfamily enzyme